MNLEQLTNDAKDLVRDVGNFIKAESEAFTRDKVEYKDLNNLVSYVDKDAERQLVAGLRKVLPEAGFITEEGTAGDDAKKSGLNWIIDPLDGTTNFIHGLPVYCVSVGLAQGKEPILGVVYDPERNEMFHGWKGGGAWKDQHRLSVSKARRLADCLLATGFPYYKFDKHDRYMKILEILMQKTHGLRRMGAAAIDLAYVATGRFEGFYEYNLNSWDMAAGVLLITEAGGRVTDFDGGDNYLFGGSIVASCGSPHQELVDVIQTNF